MRSAEPNSHRRDAEDAEVAQRNLNDLSGTLLGAAIQVHRALGPGLLESAYAECLCRELGLQRIPFRREVSLPIEYKGVRIENAYRIDLLVDNSIVVEIKAVESLLAIHEAQLLTYLRLGGWKLGFLINFNVPLLKQGIRRKVLQFEENSAQPLRPLRLRGEGVPNATL